MHTLVLLTLTCLTGTLSPQAPSRGLRDKAELEAFLDGMISAEMADHHIAGDSCHRSQHPPGVVDSWSFTMPASR